MKIKYFFLLIILSIATYASTQIVSDINKIDTTTDIQTPLNTKVKTILADIKKELDADEIIAVVMESKSGQVLSMISSNSFDPSAARYENKVIEYSHEPGSTIKPIVFSLLLEKGLVDPKEMLDGHDGNYTLGGKTIVDERKFKSLSAEDVIVYSSNIGMAQLAQRMNGKEFVDGFNKFGFSHFSGINIPYERSGSIPTSDQMDNALYKAIVSYGYGVSANQIQILKAYNAFNNNGRMVTPKIKQSNKIESRQVISPATANRMKQILIKVVNDGTGVTAKTAGLEIGGKTGTVFISKDGKHTNDSYNTSFVGFANDDKHTYTIAITVMDPQKVYYASLTAVPVFKAIVDMMVEQKYLEPSKVE